MPRDTGASAVPEERTPTITEEAENRPDDETEQPPPPTTEPDPSQTPAGEGEKHDDDEDAEGQAYRFSDARLKQTIRPL